MPLSDDETLFRTFQAAKNAHPHTVTEPTEVQLFDATLAGLRAVEASVRADQIERDAVLNEGIMHPDSKPCGVCDFAAAIRAQLTEGKSDE